MVVFLIISGLIFLVMAFVLFTPATLAINSWSEIYRLTFTPFVSVWLDAEGNYRPKLSLFFFGVNLSGKKPEKKPAKSKRKTSIKKIIRLGRSLLKSCTVRKFFISFDTDDYPLNAMIIPLLQTVRRENFSIQVNYQGEIHYDILLTVRIYRILINYFF